MASQHPIYKTYSAKEDGTILNLKSGRILKPITVKHGYQEICVYLNGKKIDAYDTSLYLRMLQR